MMAQTAQGTVSFTTGDLAHIVDLTRGKAGAFYVPKGMKLDMDDRVEVELPEGHIIRGKVLRVIKKADT